MLVCASGKCAEQIRHSISPWYRAGKVHEKPELFVMHDGREVVDFWLLRKLAGASSHMGQQGYIMVVCCTPASRRGICGATANYSLGDRGFGAACNGIGARELTRMTSAPPSRLSAYRDLGPRKRKRLAFSHLTSGTIQRSGNVGIIDPFSPQCAGAVAREQPRDLSIEGSHEVNGAALFQLRGSDGTRNVQWKTI